MPISRKHKIIAAALGVIVAIYGLSGFYLLPWLLRGKLPDLVKEQTGQTAEIREVRFNPFALELALVGFKLSTPEGANLFGFENFAIDINAFSSLTQQALVFETILLRKPTANIKRQADGSLNINRISTKPSPTKEGHNKEFNLPIAVRHLTIEEGHVDWQDESFGQPRRETVLPVNLVATNLTTHGSTPGGFDLSSGLASGGHLQLQGTLNLIPFAVAGNIKLEALNLAKLWQLSPQGGLPVEIGKGLLNLQTEYRVSADGGMVFTSSNGGMEISQLEIIEKTHGEQLIGIPAIALRGIGFDLNKRQIKAETLASNDAAIKTQLQADGRINFQALFADAPNTDAGAAPTTPSPTATETTAPSWQINLGELILSNYQIQFTDQTLKTPLPMQLSSLNINLKQFSNTGNEKLPLQLSAVFNNQGKLNLDGGVSLSPFSADLNLNLDGIQLKDFQSYLDNYLNLELVDGIFNSRGHLQLTAADDLQLLFQGNADFDDLLTRDKANNKDFLKWSVLQLQQIDLDLAKQSFAIDQVVFDQPYIRFNIKKDKSTNINDILLPQPSGKTPGSQTDKAAAENPKIEPIVRIGKIEFKDGNSNFADYSLILPFVAEMNGLKGSINGFSSDRDATAKLTLQGRVYDMAQVAINGDYQLKSGDSDIVLKFSHLPLPLITPYMAEFAGYKIEKGQMALDLQYKIQHNQLTAQNKIFIDQLTLGEHIDNPRASSLPLQLAIALLKDSEGRINLDFPVTGSLDDPQFSIGTLIADVLGNLVGKLVASPFQALGGLLDDDSDYRTVAFSAGGAELNNEETTKLDQLGKALESRPELTLEIKGMAYQAMDWPVLRFDALTEILKKMKSGELRDKGEKIRSEYIELSEDEYKRLLAKFFKEVFPLDFETTLIGAPRIKSQPDAEFYTTARQKLEAIMQPEPQRLTDLAIARANSISKYLIEKSMLDIGRVYILAPELDPADSSGLVSVLSLNVAH